MSRATMGEAISATPLSMIVTEVAVADDLGLVFTSNGADGEIDVYSLDTPLGQGTDRVT